MINPLGFLTPSSARPSPAAAPRGVPEKEAPLPQDSATIGPPPKESKPSPAQDIILNTIRPNRQQPVNPEVLAKAQEQLDRGDRGGAYLTLYKELGNEQILVQAQITTYTGFWGSGALTGNNMARLAGGDRYNVDLDQFSTDIAQGTIDAIRKDLANGGTGRLTDDQFQAADRDVWRQKGMAELFPGNIQFLDFWNHEPGDRAEAIFTPSTWNIIGAGLRSYVPNTSLFGLNQDPRNVSHLVGKRPAEFEGNPNYTIHGTKEDRFITVIDNRNGFVEAFWDNHPPPLGMLPVRQLPNEPLDPESTAYAQRQRFYRDLGANQPR